MTVDEAKTAIKAIKKQTPIKPRQGLHGMYCPKCEMNVFVEGQPYCAFCGQRLDWSEE